MTIINAKSGDLKEIIKYSTLLNKPEKAKPDIIGRCVADNRVWIAKDRNFTTAYVMVELFDEKQKYFSNSIFISELYVDEKYRGQGLGSALVKMALQADYPERYDYFSLTHDPEEEWLTRFYERFGFKKIGATDEGNIMLVKK